MTNLNIDLEHRTRYTELRGRLRMVLLHLTMHRYPEKFKQTLLDLSNSLDNRLPIVDYSRLPIKPDGFRVMDHERKGYGYKLKVLCLLRVVSMTAMYLWLFSSTHDQQDYVSCKHYIEWLENFDPQHFNVYGAINKGWYLADKREGKPGNPPDVPEWIQEGTTV